MHDALRVCVVHGPGEDSTSSADGARRLRRAVEPVGETAAADVLQSEIG